MRYFILISNRFHLFMGLRDMILKVGLNISLLPRYWLGKCLVLSDMPCGLGTSFSLLPSFVTHPYLLYYPHHPRS
jgi:hypothetical protein